MKKEELKAEWLAGSATTAFIGALFVAYGWHLSDGTIKLPFNVTISAFPDWVYFALGSLLLTLAFVLLTASMARAVPPWAFHTGRYFAPILGLVAWVAFTLSWISLATDLLVSNQWWSVVLYWGGIAFLLLLALRLFFTVVRLSFSGKHRPESSEGEPKMKEAQSLRAALFVGGLALFLFFLGRTFIGKSPEDAN